MKVFIIITFSFLLSVSVYSRDKGQLSGADTSGGGDVVICKSGSVETYSLADTFELKQKGLLRQFEKFTPNKIYSAFILSLNDQKEGLGDLVNQTVNLLFGENLEKVQWVTKLEELDDDFIEINEKFKCSNFKKEQLAIQNIDSAEVKIRSDHFNKLIPVEKELTKIHEALIYLAKAPDNTTSLRNFVKTIVDNKDLGQIIRRISTPNLKELREINEIAMSLHLIIVSLMPYPSRDMSCYSVTVSDSMIKKGLITREQWKNVYPDIRAAKILFLQPIGNCLRQYYRNNVNNTLDNHLFKGQLMMMFESFFPYTVTGEFSSEVFIQALRYEHGYGAAKYLYDNMQFDFEGLEESYAKEDQAYVSSKNIDQNLKIEVTSFLNNIIQ